MAGWARERPRHGAVSAVPRPGPPDDDALLTEISHGRLGPVRRYFARRPGVMDALIMVVFALGCFLPAVVEPAGVPGGRDDWRTGVSLALVVAGTIALYWRRRSPLVVAAILGALTVLVVAITGSTVGFEGGIAFAVYAVAASRPARTTWLVFATLVLTCALALWLWGVSVDMPDAAPAPVSPDATTVPLEWPEYLAMTGSIAIVSLIALAIGVSVRTRRLHVADLVGRAQAAARDRDQQGQIGLAAERARIAREMHDVVAHSVAVMIALADGASAALERSPDRSRAALEQLSDTGRSALADMRRVLGVLKEPGTPFEPQPGSHDLAELVARARAAGLPLRTTGLGTVLPADAGLQLAVYRIVQESLTNVLRHAPGTPQVDLDLRREADRVEVEIRDHGAAVPVADAGGTGQGVVGMRERAAVYGGVVEAGPWRQGWRVHAVLPWTHVGRTS